MNFPESKLILEKIKQSKHILLACHLGVDPDCLVSNILLKSAISKLGKHADIVCVDDIPSVYKALDPKKEIKSKIDFSKFDFKKYDLFITSDINEWQRIGIDNENRIGEMEVVNIDHHNGNYIRGIVISDVSYSSTAEMIFYVFEDWGIDLSKEEAELILMGIISDTDSFNYGSSPRVFKTVSKLISLGASYDKVNTLLWRNNSEVQLKLWSKMLANVHVDKKLKFAYSYLSYEDFKGLEGVTHPARTFADNFIRTLEDTKFGVVMLEQEKGLLKVSVRSREEDFGVVDLLRNLGGGGHFTGGGALIKAPFKKAVDKVLEASREYARNRI